MNKRLAMLLFAIGMGAATAPAYAGLCQHFCQASRAQCEASPSFTPQQCFDWFVECMETC